MKKVINLIHYKNMLLKRAGDFRVSRDLIDEDAYAEDVMFELECSWDIEPEHLDLGFVMRKNATTDLIYVEGKFCQFLQHIKKDGKETLEVPEKDTPLHQCILVEYTGEYKTFYENGSLEITADFKDGFLDGRFIHYSTAFQKIREYGFWGDEKHGLATLFYPDGRLKSVTPWYQGSRDGDVLRYNGELNQKITTYSYKEGKLYAKSK